MPREVFGTDFVFLPRADILSFEEIARVVRLFSRLGLRKVRLTGGEPLMRAELPVLVRLLSEIDNLDLALTTNGSLLERAAEPLARAGLRRVTVSLDSLDPARFKAMSDTDIALERVLGGIEAAAVAGLTPLKINAVVRRGVNDCDVLPLARYFKGTGHIVRFIEFMDVGTTNGWRLDDVVSAREIVSMIDAELPLEPVAANEPSDVARHFRYRDGSGEIGVISSVTKPFCAGCTRARLSADGKLYTCLFASKGFDLRRLLRDGSSDEAIVGALTELWTARDDRYSEVRSEHTARDGRIEMSYIGG